MNEKSISLKEYLEIILSNKRLIALITMGFAIFAGIYLIIVPPTYESTSLLRVKEENGLENSVLENMPTVGVDMVRQLMNTDAEILKSRTVVMPIIKKLEKQDKNGKYPEYNDYIRSHIITKPFKDTDILQVSARGKTPKQAQKLNYLLVNGFLKHLTRMSHDEQRETRQFLEKRVTSSRKELTIAENKLQKYQVDNKIYSPDDQVKGLTDKISLIDKIKADNDLDLETAKAALLSIDHQLTSAGKSIADSPAIDKYKVQLAELEAQKAGYIGKYTDNYPKMKEINNQINNVRMSLNKEINDIVSQNAYSSSLVQQSLLTNKFKNEAAIAVANSKNKVLTSMVAKNDAEIDALPVKEHGFIQAKRDVDVAQEIYVMLAKRLEEAKVAEVMVPHEIQIVDQATLPDKPIKPRKILTMVLSIVLGFFISAGMVIIKALIYRKLITVDDVEQELQLPVIGMIPDANFVNRNKLDTKLLDKIRKKLWRK